MTRGELMIHRVARSEAYRGSPTEIGRSMAFRDFHLAHLYLDFEQDVREEEEADRERR